MNTLHRAMHWLYVHAVKRVLFLFDPESVHGHITALGERIGRSGTLRRLLRIVFAAPRPVLQQSIEGIAFPFPTGLAAGFDYEARLPAILPALGFGFGTVGTLTHRAYQGNRRPMLGRLPKSRSLMVNKGFKNFGIGPTLRRWRGTTFEYPVGVSIGKTNDPAIATQATAVEDIISGFREAEASGVAFAYYELNISCPNLAGTVDFYTPEKLEELLSAVGSLQLSRPVFVKMPISRSDDEISALLDVLVRHTCVRGVIIGNLQGNRTDPQLVPEEAAQFPRGGFSGMPCQARSDHLIGLAYRRHGTRLCIIGCGGIFSAEDAYRKIKAGASLAQLITGLVFEGPQLVAQIHSGLEQLLSRDGHRCLADAIGSAELA